MMLDRLDRQHCLESKTRYSNEVDLKFNVQLLKKGQCSIDVGQRVQPHVLDLAYSDLRTRIVQL